MAKITKSKTKAKTDPRIGTTTEDGELILGVWPASKKVQEIFAMHNVQLEKLEELKNETIRIIKRATALKERFWAEFNVETNTFGKRLRYEEATQAVFEIEEPAEDKNTAGSADMRNQLRKLMESLKS